MSAVCQPGTDVPGFCWACEDFGGKCYWLAEDQGVVYELCISCHTMWDDDHNGRCGFCHLRPAAMDHDDVALFAYQNGGREIYACRRCHKRHMPVGDSALDKSQYGRAKKALKICEDVREDLVEHSHEYAAFSKAASYLRRAMCKPEEEN